MLSWGRKRQILYLGTIILIFILIGGTFYAIYRPRPSCFDKKQNQLELGVDCGGPCSRACPSQLIPLTIWWTRVLPVTKGNYDVAILVENQNANFGIDKIKYALRIYDKFNVLIAERYGETAFEPQEKFVIYEPSIDTKEQVADRAFLYLDDTAIWQKMKKEPSKLSVGAKNFSNFPQPRLQSDARNNTLDPIRNVKFVSVLSDPNGNAIAASQTVIDVLLGNETKPLNFTWPTSFEVEPAIIDIYPKLDL